MLFSIVGFLFFGALFILVARRVFAHKSLGRKVSISLFVFIALIWLVWLALRYLGLTGFHALPFTNFLVGLAVFLLLYMLVDLIASLFFKKEAQRIRKYAYLALIPIVIVLGYVGHHNTTHPKTTKYLVHMPKVDGLDSLRVALVTDIHIGDIIETEDVRRLVNMVQAQEPDLLLLGGDMIDYDPKYAFAPEMMALMRALTSGQDTYIVLGNHEYYAELDKKIEWARGLGTFLRDSVVEPFPGLYLIGRDSHTNKSRQQLCDLMKQIPPGTATIVLEHEPQSPEEIRDNNVSLSLHGHTHNGQLFLFWPLVALAHERTYGLYQKGPTTHVISSGYGVSTTTLRIGTHSEIVVLTLVFDK